MSLKLYAHPLASFCWKPLVALYENDTPFAFVTVNLGDAKSRAEFAAVYPPAKFPVLRDEARGQTVAESTTIIEYLDVFHPGPKKMIPADPDLAWQARMWDRFFDNYLQLPMQKIVADTFRPADLSDKAGVAEAHDNLRTAYGHLEAQIAGKTWATGDTFTLADCAAAPALIYADCVTPIGPEHKNVSAYLDRLRTRPSFHRVLKEAEPHFEHFPIARKPRL